MSVSARPLAQRQAEVEQLSPHLPRPVRPGQKRLQVGADARPSASQLGALQKELADTKAELARARASSPATPPSSKGGQPPLAVTASTALIEQAVERQAGTDLVQAVVTEAKAALAAAKLEAASARSDRSMVLSQPLASLSYSSNKKSVRIRHPFSLSSSSHSSGSGANVRKGAVR